MYLFVQTLVNMDTRESIQLQPKVTKYKENIHNVLLQFSSTVFYLTII